MQLLANTGKYSRYTGNYKVNPDRVNGDIVCIYCFAAAGSCVYPTHVFGELLLSNCRPLISFMIFALLNLCITYSGKRSRDFRKLEMRTSEFSSQGPSQKYFFWTFEISYFLLLMTLSLKFQFHQKHCYYLKKCS